ncbi:hypothetical protein LCGC14_1205800 [marine sediment metagenome]|uniref:Uncharacterized protein n=1 Tax=marine sediment metagenome TaxID=412755 RepID=A0A0F9LFF8_9ZZZZ
MADCKIRSYNVVRARLFGKKPTGVQRLISVRSKPHTHSEYQFSKRYDWASFSATIQGNDNGARFKHIGYSHERERWDTVIVPMTDEQEDEAWYEAKSLEGMPYDIIGQISHATRFKIWKPSKKKIWCSKAVNRTACAGREDFLAFIGQFGIADEIRPDELDMLARYFF